MKIFDINENIVSDYYAYIESKIDNNYTHNNRFQPLVKFYNYLIEKKWYQLQNPFNKTIKTTNKNANTI